MSTSIQVTNTSTPQPIEFNGASIRIVLDSQGDPLFIAKDLVEAVGATWRGTDGISHIPADFRGSVLYVPL
jgi:prophage antirepressor-like protein